METRDYSGYKSTDQKGQDRAIAEDKYRIACRNARRVLVGGAAVIVGAYIFARALGTSLAEESIASQRILDSKDKAAATEALENAGKNPFTGYNQAALEQLANSK